MNRTLGVPRIEVNVIQEQPLPWRAPEVMISFGSGPTIVCRVSRQPGDVLRVEHEGVGIAEGTSADLQWTQDGRGSFAAGTVIAPPPSAPAGIYIRVDQSVTGIERRLSTRVPVRVPATLHTVNDRVVSGWTRDVSLGGANILLEPPGHADARAALAAAGIAGGASATVDLTLPSGIHHLRCQITGVDQHSAEIRVRFLHLNIATMDELGTFLHDEQHRMALHPE
ncbi:PilZ domain-containing protein [Actinoplanes missouriensis]|uniref:PilZ domain-containing protein n=1 Tax=Actinoplanes missouriensis TaxID=1866 RepID=UPI0033E1D590